MNKTLTLQKLLIIFGIPILMILSMILIARSSIFNLYSNKLTLGVTLDLLLTIPLVYFLLIRNTSIPKTTTVPLMIFGLIIGSIILPSENQYYLNLFKTWVFPVIEIVVISFIIFNVRKTIKKLKRNKAFAFDFFSTLKETCNEILPKRVVMPVVTEIAVFYYGFIYWKKRDLNKNEFSYHKNSGTISLLVAIIFIIGIETVAFHFLLLKWSDTAAWVLTFLSIYSAIQIFGFLKSIIKRPISIEDNKLKLRYGILSEVSINLNEIESLVLTSKEIEFNKKTRKLSPFGELESHNVVIRLKKENTLCGLYGIKRKFTTLAFYIDNKEEFKNQIENKGY